MSKLLALSALALVAFVSPAGAQQPAPPAADGGGGRGGFFGACKADLATLCKDTSGLGARLQCLKVNQDKLSPECMGTIRAVIGTVQQKAAAFAASPNAPRPLKACQQDLATLCPDLAKGEGGRISCLRDNKPKLSAGCSEALESVRAQVKDTKRACEADRARLCPAVGDKVSDQMKCLRERQAELTGECKQLVTAAKSAAATTKVKAPAKSDAFVPPPPASATPPAVSAPPSPKG